MYGTKTADGKPQWLHGLLKRPEVGKLLPKVDGNFLVRDSTKRPGDYVLSVYLKGKVQHFVIENKNALFGIDDGPKYRSLAELVDFYQNHPDSPTRLTDAVLKPGEKPAFNPRQKPAPAPPRETQMGFEDLDDIYSDKPEDRPPLPGRAPNPEYSVSVSKPEGAYGNKEIKGAPKKEMTEAEKAAEQERKKEQQRLAREAIASLKMEEMNIDTPAGADVAYERERQFEREALLTEALNIWWLNNMLKNIGDGKAQVNDVKGDVKSGVYLIQVLAHLSGKKTPKYSKNPKMAVQFKDNWNALVAFMRNLGISVDKDEISGFGDDAEVDVSLNADLLGDMDRREHLKMFTKIMLYENFLKRDQ